jgi:hypothetical protein
MKVIAGYLCVAVGLVLAGAVCLGAGLLNRSIARAQQSVIASKYDEADQAFATSERYLAYESHLPWIGDGAMNDIRTRRALIRYWQRRYAVIISQQADGGNGVGADNIGLQLVGANAVYRAGQIQAKDRQAMLRAIDAGIQANLAVLKNATRQDDAAYNYEYLVRLRNDVQDPRIAFRPPKMLSDSKGLSGELMESGDSNKFKTRIPLTIDERKKDGSAGKVPPVRRKG